MIATRHVARMGKLVCLAPLPTVASHFKAIHAVPSACYMQSMDMLTLGFLSCRVFESYVFMQASLPLCDLKACAERAIGGVIH